MSNAVLTAVWKRSKSKAGARLVLLALADEANDQGYVTAYGRSQTHIAKKANMSVNAVRVALKALQELGELEVLAPGGGRLQTDYRLVPVPVAQAAPSNRGGSQTRGQDPSDEGAAPSQTGRPSSLSSPVSPRNERASLDDATSDTADPQLTLVAENGDRVQVADAVQELFDDWWHEYPRKIGKKRALVVWRRVVKELGGITKAEPILIDGGNAWLQHWNREKTAKHLIPHPTTWLERGDYEAEPVPSTPQRRAR